MAYAPSANIDVFPFEKSRASVSKIGNRLFYEQNVAGIISNLINSDGYVIDYDSSNNILIFNIKGYTFRVSRVDEDEDGLLEGKDALYAVITLIKDDETDLITLSGQDDNGEFKGVIFNTSSSSLTSNQYELKLLEKIDDSWEIPTESKYKFKYSDLQISGIDGKH